jgi:hypothetical protein
LSTAEDPWGHLISETLNISLPVMAFNSHAKSINPRMRTTEYSKKVPTNPANVFALDAAKNAVPVKRPSTMPPPLPFAIYLNARKESFDGV